MKILLCAATELEIAPTIQFSATQESGNIQIVITGIGLMASTFSIAKAIAAYQPDVVIQAGIAGSLDENLPLGEVVTVKTETVGDLGVQENSCFHSLFDMDLLSDHLSPWTNRQLVNQNSLLQLLPYRQVTGVTVNEISTNGERIAYYRKQLQAQIETMEGAALHYTCLMEKTAFLQLRAISNSIGERDKTKWEMKEAIHHLNRELQTIITKHLKK